jgi:hypothetical protein
MDVCVRLFCVCVVLRVGSGLATGWSPVQGVLLAVYRIRKPEEEVKIHQGLSSPLLNVAVQIANKTGLQRKHGIRIDYHKKCIFLFRLRITGVKPPFPHMYLRLCT